MEQGGSDQVVGLGSHPDLRNRVPTLGIRIWIPRSPRDPSISHSVISFSSPGTPHQESARAFLFLSNKRCKNKIFMLF